MIAGTNMITFLNRFILFAALHSLCATHLIKNRLHVSESQAYRLCYNVASLLLFGWVMAAYRNSPVLYFAPGNWSLLLYLLQLGIAVILALCLIQTGIGEFMGVTKKTTTTFTRTGCYSVVRHPLYFFSLLFMAVNPVMTMQWLLLTIMSSIYFVVGSLIEEKRMVAEFGDAYRSYQRDVPFLIPGLSRLT